jgi:hypothetical protein
VNFENCLRHSDAERKAATLPLVVERATAEICGIKFYCVLNLVQQKSFCDPNGTR